MNEKRKIILVGCDFVGIGMAYNFLDAGGADELVLIGVDQERVIGEVMDLQHGLPYIRGKMSIKAGGYEKCWDATVAMITADVTQKPTGTRLDLTMGGTVVVKSATEQIMTSGFDGILVIANDPVGATTYVAQKVSRLPAERVIGSGTILNTARLRYMMNEYLDVSISNIRAHIMGEYGDSSSVPWANAYVGCKNLLDPLDEKGRGLPDLHDIYISTQQAGYKIVRRKRSVYYGIGLSLNRPVYAILDDKNVILIVSAHQNNEHGQEGLYIGVPATVNRQGVREIVRLDLNEVDQVKPNQNCETARDINTDAVDPLLQKTNSALPVQCVKDGKSGVPAYRG